MFFSFYSLPHMVRTLSNDTQNNIKNLLKFGYSYSIFIKRILEIYESTIREYKRKFFPDMAPSLSARHTLISATSGITFAKSTTEKNAKIAILKLAVSYFFT